MRLIEGSALQMNVWEHGQDQAGDCQRRLSDELGGQSRFHQRITHPCPAPRADIRLEFPQSAGLYSRRVSGGGMGVESEWYNPLLPRNWLRHRTFPVHCKDLGIDECCQLTNESLLNLRHDCQNTNP